jgi:putative IMPACT (imprinted ancient) family translation regulator
MLNTLLHGEVGEIVAVCTRYYGGTKLGTGGLSRAYSGGVKLLLESLPTQERVDRISLLVVVDYGSADPLKRCLGEVEAILEREEYGEQVEYRVAIPQEHHSRLVQVIADITKGSGIVRVL